MGKYWNKLVLPLALLAILHPSPGAAAGEVARPTPAVPETEAGGTLSWVTLADGLDLALLAEAAADQEPVRVTVLRFDPARYEFSLHSVAWDGPTARGIEEWAEALDLSAAINAGMYLPDGKTSTGYMRRGQSLNNSHIAGRYGAFFVCGPRREGLPPAAVLDRAVDDWEALLSAYDVVVQNFRLFGPGGVQVWPEDGPVHAVAALAQDQAGNILFLHCREAVSVHRFVDVLNAHPDLRLRAAMYVEGGSQAAMTLRLPGSSATWAGRNAASLLLGGKDGRSPLPNVIGARPRTAQAPTTRGYP